MSNSPVGASVVLEPEQLNSSEPSGQSLKLSHQNFFGVQEPLDGHMALVSKHHPFAHRT
jgi:hypothetical protein